MTEDQGISNVLAEAKQIAEIISSSLPAKIEIAALSLNSRLPFKALSLRELLIHRVAELAVPAVELFEQRRVLPAIVLARAVVETVALTFALYRQLESFLGSHDVAAFDEFLMRSTVGSRWPDWTPRATNIVTLVGHVEKAIPGFGKAYDSLSEYAHPNWAGVLGTFGAIDQEAFELALGPNRRTPALASGVNALSGALLTFHHFYNEMADMIYRLNDYFEAPGSIE